MWILLQHPVKEQELTSNVLYLELWNKIVGDLDHFIGRLRIPFSSLNLKNDEICHWFSFVSKGNS